MLFRQFFEEETCTYTYFVGCKETKQAVLIDPVLSDLEIYLSFLKQEGYELLYCMDTHVHADHITAADQLRKNTGCKSIVHEAGGVGCADRLVKDNEHIQIGKLDIEVRHTPGHTNACVSYVVDDRVFTGDALLIDGCGRTDFQAGNASLLYDSIHNKIYTLADDTLVYPGHDYNGRRVSSVIEQKTLNKRLSLGQSKEQFMEIMKELNLPHPKKIQEALPANLACGQVQ